VILEELGWNTFFEAAWNDAERGDSKPARIVAENREVWQVSGEFGEARAQVSGKLRLEAGEGGGWPAVGDWVSVEGDEKTGVLIKQVLPRRTQLVRKEAGKRIAEQVLAANADVVFVVMGLDGDVNLRRMDRYLAQVWECGARAVVVLNKTDVCADSEARIAEVERNARCVPVLAVSATTGAGFEGLSDHLTRGKTAVLLGSSGVGKSSIVNRLLGEQLQIVQPVRASDRRGRHTTTGRHLLFLENGAMIIDTPGLRELQLWDAESGLQQVFADLQELSSHCRFRDCRHQGEPGCAVAAAVADGSLDEERVQSHRKLQREQEFLKRKVDASAKQKSTQKIKTIMRGVRQLYRERDEKGKL
jgi:ribosome biogenesis GTPase / thiamine phosphate phosphatase